MAFYGREFNGRLRKRTEPGAARFAETMRKASATDAQGRGNRAASIAKRAKRLKVSLAPVGKGAE
jgi:hypothetical protein